jgi:hypothetical protein
MQLFQRILIFFVLPAIAPLLFPPEIIGGAWIAILLDVILFAALGFALTRGRLTALTLSIFIQGLNVIVRLMMFFPNAATPNGTFQIPYIIASLLSMGISLYLVLRLDRVDIRSQMV